MDKASEYELEDSNCESWQIRINSPHLFLAELQLDHKSKDDNKLLFSNLKRKKYFGGNDERGDEKKGTVERVSTYVSSSSHLLDLCISVNCTHDLYTISRS